jgi:hypothetical protein
MGLNPESPIIASGPERGLAIPITTSVLAGGAGAGAGTGAGAGLAASLVQPGITVKITTMQIISGIAYFIIFLNIHVPPVYLRSTLLFPNPVSHIHFTSPIYFFLFSVMVLAIYHSSAQIST